MLKTLDWSSLDELQLSCCDEAISGSLIVQVLLSNEAFLRGSLQFEHDPQSSRFESPTRVKLDGAHILQVPPALPSLWPEQGSTAGPRSLIYIVEVSCYVDSTVACLELFIQIAMPGFEFVGYTYSLLAYPR